MLTLAMVAVALGLPTPSALAVGGSVELTASDRLVTHGDQVTLSGAVSAGGPCAADRGLVLEWRPADSTAFATVAQGTTVADGTFSFDQAQQHTGRYRVTASSVGTCDAIVSDTVLVRVRARVESTLLAGSLTAGSCVDVTAIVTPSKSGQEIVLQQRTAGSWEDLETLTLDANSLASTSPCFGWKDLGIVRLRLRWVAQDLVNETSSGPVLAFELQPARWMERIDTLIGDRTMSVSVGEGGEFLFGRSPRATRTPASNEKLLLSMALLDAFDADIRFATRAAATASPSDGILRADLWILGRGDPKVDRRAMATLAARIADAGITRIVGRVLGSTSYFRRDWGAVGWNDAARRYVARPTALTFDGNLRSNGRNLRDPERRAAEVLTEELEAIGIRVKGRAGAAEAPTGLTVLASVRSRTLAALLAKMLRPSDNFIAEVLGKRLAVETAGTPGTIAKGADAIRTWAEGQGVSFSLFDSSGLSYENQVNAEGIVRLLWSAEAATWGPDLFEALPTGGQGTLRRRLHDVLVRAKTGTLTGISALSGWVWLERLETWAEFSILSGGMSKATASDLEDRIVRILQNQAR